jgi:preprotein translocase subunit SecG
MPYYYYILLFIVLLVIFLIIRFLVSRKKSVPLELFFKGLQNENSGNFEEALISYESALNEVNKIRFNSRLKHKILEKIKLLHTLIEHKNSFRFGR